MVLFFTRSPSELSGIEVSTRTSVDVRLSRPLLLFYISAHPQSSLFITRCPSRSSTALRHFQIQFSSSSRCSLGVFHVIKMTTLEPCSPDHHRVQDLLRHCCRRLLSVSLSTTLTSISTFQLRLLEDLRELFLQASSISRTPCFSHFGVLVSSELSPSCSFFFASLFSGLLVLLHLPRASSTASQSLWHFGLRYKPSPSLRANLLNAPLLSSLSSILLSSRSHWLATFCVSVPHNLSATARLHLLCSFFEQASDSLSLQFKQVSCSSCCSFFLSRLNAVHQLPLSSWSFQCLYSFFTNPSCPPNIHSIDSAIATSNEPPSLVSGSLCHGSPIVSSIT